MGALQEARGMLAQAVDHPHVVESQVAGTCEGQVPAALLQEVHGGKGLAAQGVRTDDQLVQARLQARDARGWSPDAGLCSGQAPCSQPRYPQPYPALG